jgi:hypothetical protein
MYKSLHLKKITDTLEQLEARIGERFSDCGLLQVCKELHQLARASGARIDWIVKPHLGVRCAVGSVIFLSLALVVVGLRWIKLQTTVPSLGEFVQVTEALLNVVVLLGASLFFLFTLETRIKRSRTLKALHELRSIAHVVDMHQLTKDPVMSYQWVKPTASSPKRDLNPYELRRYLDYCSELLALIGKTAALYSQKLPDAQIVTAASEVETLCATMSHKVWQKIMILHADKPQSGP